jgi:hypothetical protein
MLGRRRAGDGRAFAAHGNSFELALQKRKCLSFHAPPGPRPTRAEAFRGFGPFQRRGKLHNPTE